MANLSTIYDAIYTKVSTVLSTHKELPFPQNIELNDDLNLKAGYAVQITQSERVNRTITGYYWVKRQFVVTNTLSIAGADTQKTIRKSAEKTLLENQKLLISALENDVTLSNNCNNMSYVGDNGIEFVYVEQKNYIMLRSVFSFEYAETLT